MLTRYEVLLLCSTVLFLPATGQAATFQWAYQDPTYGLLSGSAGFSVLSDSSSNCGATTCYDLQIILTNDSTNPANQSSQVLEGLFFDLLDANNNKINIATGMLSAAATGGLLNTTGTTITSGSAGTNICAAGQALSSNIPLCASVAHAWENAYSTTGFTVGGTAYTQHYGIGDAGWGLFQGSSVGNPINGVVPGNGVGIASKPNSSITKNYPFVYGTATFTLYGLTTNSFTVANVKAAYGTAPEAAESAAPLVSGPEPASITMILAGLLLVFAGLAGRRRRTGSPPAFVSDAAAGRDYKL